MSRVRVLSIALLVILFVLVSVQYLKYDSLLHQECPVCNVPATSANSTLFAAQSVPAVDNAVHHDEVHHDEARHVDLNAVAVVPVAPVVNEDALRQAEAAKARRAKAAIVILARNTDADGLKRSLSQLEARFNKVYNYPYVFLNDAEFTEEFKEKMRALSKAKMSFGRIPTEHWSYPSWIDQKLADEKRADMGRRNIIYGDSLPYRHMCRFNSGFFFRHPLLEEYDYYWRVEPHVDFFCDVKYDPFLYMMDNNKDYGFVITIGEYIETIPTLWDTTVKFMKEHPSLIPERNSIKYLLNDEGGYNLCHFWSNFEIASLKFLRSVEYLTYFDYLDKAGGFFYERWGDAPVHSIAAGMFLAPEKIHYFEDIGYYHGPYSNCPSNPVLCQNCQCDPTRSSSLRNNCLYKWRDLYR